MSRRRGIGVCVPRRQSSSSSQKWPLSDSQPRSSVVPGRVLDWTNNGWGNLVTEVAWLNIGGVLSTWAAEDPYRGSATLAGH